ncbi:MAG: hypothetical protein GX927_14770 [Lentisphaerae bacterium]|nr:hypothetical protein [Lentisphaerota bacterium]
MNTRIERLINTVLTNDIFPKPQPVEYDQFDEKLAEPMRIAKRLTEYMEAQPAGGQGLTTKAKNS